MPLHRRAVAAAMATVWLLGLGASVWHADAEEHRYCAEHRAFEEVGPRATVAQAMQLASADELDRVEEHPGERAEAHETCAFAEHGVQGVADPQPPCAALLPAAEADHRAAPDAAVAPQIALLHLAPKSSPPVASV